MRPKRSIISVITSVCVGLMALAPSFALAEGDSGRSGLTPFTVVAAGTIAVTPLVLAKTPTPEVSSSMDGGILENLARWQQTVQEIHDYPELVLTIGAASLSVLAFSELWKFMIKDSPAYFTARGAFKKTEPAFLAGQTFEADLEKLTPPYEKAASDYQHASSRLENLRRRLLVEIDISKVKNPQFRDAIEYARRITRGLSPWEAMHTINEDEILWRKLMKSAPGKQWYKGWNRAMVQRSKAHSALVRSFAAIRKLVVDYSNQLEEAATGLIRNPELRQPPVEMNLRLPDRHESAEIGTVIHNHPSGMPVEMHDARKAPRQIQTTVAQCRLNLAKMVNVRESHSNRMFTAKAKGLAFGTGAVAAVGSYFFGNWWFKEVHKVDAVEIVQEKKKEQAVQDARMAAQATSPVSMADTLKNWQKEETPALIMEAMRKIFQTEVIPKFTVDIRKIGKGQLDAALETRVKEIESVPEVLDSIVRNALGDALSELKIAELNRLEKALLADSTDPSQSDAKELREQVLAYMLAASPKHIWPNLVANPTAYPIDATSTMPALVKSLRVVMEELRQKLAADAAARAKVQTTSTPAAPAPSNGTTTSTVNPITAPSSATAGLTQLMEDLSKSIAASPVTMPDASGLKP